MKQIFKILLCTSVCLLFAFVGNSLVRFSQYEKKPASLNHTEGCLPAKLSTISNQGCFSSAIAGKNIPYTVIGSAPKDKVPYVIFLHGRGGNHNQLLESCGEKFFTDYFRQQSKVPFLIFSPKEPVPSYWKDMFRGPDVLQMVNREFISHVESHFPINNKRCISGISMGGHGAIYSTLKYPGMYTCLFGLSPIFRSLDSLLNEDRAAYGESQEEFKKRDPFTILQNGQTELPRYSRLVIGREDELISIGNTLPFFEWMMKSPKYSGVAEISPKGRHDRDYWCPQLRKALDFISESLSHSGLSK